MKGKATLIVDTGINGETSAVRYTIGNVNDYTVKDAGEKDLLIIANARRVYDPRYTSEDKSPKTHSLRYHLADYLKKKNIRPSNAQTYHDKCNNALGHYGQYLRQPMCRSIPLNKHLKSGVGLYNPHLPKALSFLYKARSAVYLMATVIQQTTVTRKYS